MTFSPLETPEQLQKVKDNKGTSIIFKHNVTCPISKGVKARLESDGEPLTKEAEIYIVDLINNRPISDAVAETFNVEHQSPQLLVIKDGSCTYDEALNQIAVDETLAAL